MKTVNPGEVVFREQLRLGLQPCFTSCPGNVHNYCYPPKGLAATRVFLAATGKTLGLSLEAQAGEVGVQASTCFPLRRPDTLKREPQLISWPHAGVTVAPGFNS